MRKWPAHVCGWEWISLTDDFVVNKGKNLVEPHAILDVFVISNAASALIPDQHAAERFGDGEGQLLENLNS